MLVGKGYYAGVFIWAVYSAFVLAKVIRDNEEDGFESEVKQEKRTEE